MIHSSLLLSQRILFFLTSNLKEKHDTCKEIMKSLEKQITISRQLQTTDSESQRTQQMFHLHSGTKLQEPKMKLLLNWHTKFLQITMRK